MSLLAPEALALFGLAPLLVLLYFLKLRRRQVVVPSLLIWRATQADPRANALWHRLRRRAHLLLMLLILLLLALAAARPYLPLRGLPGTSLIVVVDLSGSMKAREDDGTTRFDEARKRLLHLIGHLGRGQEMLVIAAAANPTVAAPFTADRKILAAAALKLRPHDAPADLASALATAQALASERPGAGIVVFSDLAGRRLPDPPAGASLVYETLGRTRDNLAVTTLAVRRRASSSADSQALVAIENYADVEHTVDLEVSLAGEVLLARPLTLKPRGGDGVLVDLPAGGAGLVEARIDANDALAADDVARAVVVPQQALTVAVVGKLDPWLERALTIDPRVHLVAAGPAQVTVYVHTSPPLPLPGHALLIDPEDGGFIGVGLSLDTPLVTRFERDHPVMSYVDLAGVAMARAHSLKPPPGAHVLAETTAGPLLVAGEAARGRWLALAMDPLDSDLPLRVAYPLLIQNALRWMSTDTAGAEAVQAGETAQVAVAEDAQSLELVSPAGERRTVSGPQAGGRVLLSALDDAGMWRIEGRGFSADIAVNAGSETASDITPGVAPRAEAAAAAHAAAAVLTGQALTPWVLLAVLVLVLGEWYAYHRRLLG